MNLRFTERLRKSYEASPPEIQRAFDKQAHLLSQNLGHPSLRAKKYEKQPGVWQARVNRDWRFYFTIETDVYVIIGLSRHPK
jgi:plasmid maintenance system killer protein